MFAGMDTVPEIPPVVVPPPHILIVDDDREIRDLLARFLERHGLRVTAVRDAREARRALPNGHFQMVVLDLMLPGESGLDFARWLRSEASGHADVGLVMLTAMGEETDRIIGLELGADDYVPKPFNPRELLARMRAVLRRAGETATRARTPQPQTWRFSGWTLDPMRRRLINPDQVEVPVTGGRCYAIRDPLAASAGDGQIDFGYYTPPTGISTCSAETALTSVAGQGTGDLGAWQASGFPS